MKTFVALVLLLTSCFAADEGSRFRFEGIVMRMGPETFNSGVLSTYRLMQYHVVRVANGNFEGKTIVVDHPVLDYRELARIHTGDTVCVSVKRVKHLSSRYNAPGIRDPKGKIKWFYVATDEVQPSPCS
jgi:hypothetical protein